MTTNPDPQSTEQLASLAVNAANALRDEKRHYQIACEENARLRAVVARIRQMADAWEQRLPEAIRTPAVVTAIRAALEPAAVSAPPPTRADDRADVLREAADALPEADLPFVPPMDRRRVADWLRRMADEAQQQPETPASTAPLAAGLPLVKGRCPACGRASLFLGSGGYVTCSVVDCREPDAATTVLEQPASGPGRVADEEQPAETQAVDRAAVYREVADRLVAKYGVTNRAASQIRQWAADEPSAERAAVGEQPDTQTHAVSCSAVALRVHHAPHDWEPQPGMEPIPCPGYPAPSKEA